MLSVIIPVFNNAQVLAAQLSAVTAQCLNEEWEVIVADNGSIDGSIELARRWAGVAASPVRVVDASAREGPAAARNIGARAARGDRLVFCDGDDIVAPGWLRALVESLQTATVAVGALDCSTLNGRPPAPPVDPWPHQFGYLPAGLGANMAVHRSAFEAVGGFDEDLRVGEDLDLCWRLQLAGYRLERVMDAVVAKRARSAYDRLLVQSVGYGRSDAVLFRRFRRAGMPRGLWLTVRSWGWLVVNSWSIFSVARRALWLRVLFIRLGRLLGSVEQRVFYP